MERNWKTVIHAVKQVSDMEKTMEKLEEYKSSIQDELDYQKAKVPESKETKDMELANEEIKSCITRLDNVIKIFTKYYGIV